MSDSTRSGHLLTSLQRILPGSFRLEETPLESGGQIVGWHSVLMKDRLNPIAGGTAKTRPTARRIAIAEAFERSLVRVISLDTEQFQHFLLDEIPSCSGFAAGFQSQPTHERALFEAIERWSWSQWIDKKYFLPSISSPPCISSFDSYLLQPFKEHLYLERKFSLNTEGIKKNLSFRVFLGLTDTGIFPGSRVSEENDSSWSHAFIEAHRNYYNFGPPCLYPAAQVNSDMISQRASFFSKRKETALMQIKAAQNVDWPAIQIKLWKRVQTNIDGIYLSRAVCKDHIPWHLGPVERFVY